MSPGHSRNKILVVAAVLGLVTATLIYLYVSSARSAAGHLIEAVVATEYIPARTAISPGMIRVAKTPASDAKPDMATTLPEVMDRVTLAPVEKGEVVSLTATADKSAVFGLAAIIPPGKRAMSITVDAADVVPGLLQPGQRVDIVASFVSGPDSVAKTILQNVPLLAVNGSATVSTAEPPAAAGKPSTAAPPPTAMLITIAVTPWEAERLVAAQYKGKLRLGLRGIRDNLTVQTPGASTNLLMGNPPAAVSVTRAPVPAPATQKPTSPGPYPAKPGLGTGLPPMPLAGLALAPPPQKSVRVIKGTEVIDVPVDE